MRKIMKLTIYWAIAVMTVSTAFSQTQASTFQNPKIEELYTENNRPELYCLAQNIYFEAKSEPLAGQYAVADVVLNRVNDTRYPNTICEVVREGPIKESWKTKQDPNLSDDERIYYPRKNRCQFSWYCDGKSDKPKEHKAWRDAMHIANGVYNGHLDDLVEGATHYHAHYVNPSWADTKTYVTRIDDHIFYKWEIKDELNRVR